MGTFDPHARPPVVLEDGRTWQFAARVIAWTDGDTCLVDCLVDVGFERMSTERRRIRLLGVNTPETRGTSGAERERALQAHAFVAARWPGQSVQGERILRSGSPVVVDVVKFDKYGGRDDGRVIDMSGTDIAQALVQVGLGDPYDGGAR